MDAVGSDVLTLHHLAVESDPRYRDNELYLQSLKGEVKAVTVYDLLNLIGSVADAVGEREARELYAAYLRSEEHVVLFPRPPGSWEELMEELMPYVLKGLDHNGALIAMTVASHHEIRRYVTWRKLYRGKMPVNVVSPKECLRSTQV
ncbi:MAG: hypothetical protein NZ957_04305 [Thaumarchaeota archaeon]|nr:hypothetical protein [Candidatus Calditenuaceae archaeon]MDW8041881.1 hypothetical protein [Nitrososphaerota archaeon]